MVGAEELRHAAGVRELVALSRLAESDRERLDRLAHVARHYRDNEAGVDPSAQHRAERDVAHETNAHRLVEPFQEALPPLALGDGAVSLDRGMRVLPIPLGAYAVLVRHEDVTGKKLRHADERCPRPGDESEGEIRVDRR